MSDKDCQEKLGQKQVVAKLLLELGCVSLSPEKPFTYASGLKGPIYCDNRKLLSHPEAREQVVTYFISTLKNLDLTYDATAGLATGGIPYSAFVAQKLNEPMLYVRSKAKAHGKKSLIEGDISQIKSIVLIEDLINQGSSLEKVLGPIKNDGLQVQAVLAVVSYQMQKAEQVSKNYQVPFYSLTDFSTLVSVGRELEMITEHGEKLLREWQESPSIWGK